jgi:hypothetical protein
LIPCTEAPSASKSIRDYLPSKGFVRIKVDGASKGTYLFPVTRLQEVAARHPKKKIAVSYARYYGGQRDGQVIEVRSVCIDLDARNHGIRYGVKGGSQQSSMEHRFHVQNIVYLNGIRRA